MYHPGNRGNETLFKVLEASVGDSVKLTIETVSFPMKKCDLLVTRGDVPSGNE